MNDDGLTLEGITLFLELRKGNVPDLVIFYDGVNEAIAAFEQRTAGLPIDSVIAKYSSQRALLPTMEELRRLNTYRLVQRVISRLGTESRSPVATEQATFENATKVLSIKVTAA